MNWSEPGRKFVPGLFLIFLPLLFLFSGCATLPRIEDAVTTSYTRRTTPAIVRGHRPLSKDAVDKIIGRLKGQDLPADLMERHILVEETITGRPLTAGNRATLLVNGPATYQAMQGAIQNASDHINFETFTFNPDEAGQSFAELFARKQSQNVQVNIIYDSLGSLSTPASFFDRLRKLGVLVLAYNPIDPLSLMTGRDIHRDHRKIMVVDGRIAFTGGVNVSSDYSSMPSGLGSDEKGAISWRDTDVQIEGPAVAEFQKLFMETWKRQKGLNLPPRDYFPPLEEAGNEFIRVIASTPGENNRDTYLMYLAAFSFAVKSIYLTNSYFAPDEQTLKLLTAAARRGVDIKIILPSKSDSRLLLYAGRSHYERLLQSGVRVYEHRSGMLHAKTAVIDGVWSSVGSTNMDLWSYLRNDEVNAVILGKNFTTQMESMFADDLGNSNEITLAQWRKRSVSERLKERFTRLMWRFL